MLAVVAAVAALGLAWLVTKARADHRKAMAARAGLLDAIAGVLQAPRRSVGDDGFPRYDGLLADGRNVRIELVADSLTTRRLPQLWLAVTVRGDGPAGPSFGAPSFGALSRPAGSEFYSWVHGMPAFHAAPASCERSVLMRGDPMAPNRLRAVSAAAAAILADPKVKEIAARGGAVRVVLQAAEGDRVAHLWLRQMHFRDANLNRGAILGAIAIADRFAAALDGPARPVLRMIA